ncbi:glycosyltransferase [Capnocytophaga canimorsus]|uniref:glycosyltransferase n=1 Tax=Capnocytophaga canimorsus TaxID=28188 RepID=UPI003859EB5C
MNTKIYFVCPNNKQATGGVKQIYRQVEILSKNGFNTCVLHEKIGKKEKWFDSAEIPIEYSPLLFKQLKYMFYKRKIKFIDQIKLFFLEKRSKKIEKNAILVLPEIYGDCIHRIEPSVKKVIFNQGCYLTFSGYSINKDYEVTPYNHTDTLATIVASHDAFNYLTFAFAQVNIQKITLGINDRIFNYSTGKQKQICFMPRKLTNDLTQVINILKQRGLKEDWKLVPIDNKSEKEVAEIMKKSIFFLNFNRCEGFGLPAVEAMACGCYIIGYHGQGGKEYFNPDFSFIIEDGNIIQYVQKIEEMIRLYELNPEKILQKGKQASEFALSNYSLEIEEKQTVSVWKKIIEKHLK